MEKIKILILLTTTMSLISLSIPGAFAAEAGNATDVSTAAGRLEWNAEMDCSACHPKQVGSMKAFGTLASVHIENGVDGCFDCHDDVKLEEKHAMVVPGKPFFVKARKFSKDFCLKCHGDYAELSDRTSDSKALTDTKGLVVNPHNIPISDKHYKTDECYTCHRVHKRNPDLMRYCAGCHHTGEFKCGTCHP